MKFAINLMTSYPAKFYSEKLIQMKFFLKGYYISSN
jgi:hypothetical protein